MKIEIRQLTRREWMLFAVMSICIGLTMIFSGYMWLAYLGLFPLGGGIFYISLESGENILTGNDVDLL